MAKVKIKGKKVTGTKKKDKIVSTGKGVWKKALTVNAGKGNDIINFKKSKANKNKLYGQAGNDIIYGGKKVDYIYGGDGNDKLYGYNGNDVIYAGNGNDFIDGGNGNDKIWGNSGNNTLKGGVGNDIITGGTGNDSIYGNKGNDQINAGKGNNTIYFEKGDGADTVTAGGGVDTLVFAGETQASLSAKFAGNNLVLTGKNGGNTVTLKDYANGNHSAQWTTIGKTTVRTDSLVAKNPVSMPRLGDDYKYVGTSMPDEITVENYLRDATEEHRGGTEVWAQEGDDSILINGTVEINYSGMPVQVYTGKGNDTVTLSNVAWANLHLEAGTGNDTITGLGFIDEDHYNPWGGYCNKLCLDVSNDAHLLLREFGTRKYILGEKKGDDLVIKLTNGETITVQGYNNLNYSEKQNSLLYGKNWCQSGGYSSSVDELLLYNEPIMLDKNHKTLDKTSSTDTVWVGAKDDANYTVKLGNANSNNVYINKNGNHNITVGNGYNNNIIIAATTGGMMEPPTAVNGNQTVTVGHGHNNRIGIYTNDTANVTIGNGYDNDIIIYNGKGSTVTTGTGDNWISINTDKRHYTNNTVYSHGNDVINAYGNTNVVLYGEDAEKRINLSSGSSAAVNGVFNIGVDGVTMFNFGTDANNVMVYREADSEDLQLVTRHFGTVANLKDVMDDVTTGSEILNRVRIFDGNSEFNVNELWSYYDMTHENTNTFTRTEYYDKQGEGIDTSFFVDGTTSDDFYCNFCLSDTDGGHNIINDFGGDSDILAFGNDTYQDSYQNFGTFFDVYKDENGSWQIGDDLIFINDFKEFREFESGGAVYVKVTDFRGDGKIEIINDYNSNGFNYNKLDTVKAQVSSWLTSNGRNYASAQDAIDDLCTNYNADKGTVLESLQACYNSAWTDNMYGQH